MKCELRLVRDFVVFLDIFNCDVAQVFYCGHELLVLLVGDFFRRYFHRAFQVWHGFIYGRKLAASQALQYYGYVAGLSRHLEHAYYFCVHSVFI